MHSRDWFFVLLAFLFPPIPVAVKTGFSCELLLNVILFALFWLPGFIHACYVISKHPTREGRIAVGQDDSEYGAV